MNADALQAELTRYVTIDTVAPRVLPPEWTPPPPTPEELARKEAARLAAEAERARWEAMSPEERAAAEGEIASIRLYVAGLINRTVC